jgi:hypothetical protein
MSERLLHDLASGTAFARGGNASRPVVVHLVAAVVPFPAAVVHSRRQSSIRGCLPRISHRQCFTFSGRWNVASGGGATAADCFALAPAVFLFFWRERHWRRRFPYFSGRNAIMRVDSVFHLEFRHCTMLLQARVSP